MAITNLTNTKWYLNDTLEPIGEYIESGWGGAGYSTHYMINFTSNDVAFDRFGCEIHESPVSGSQDDMQGELQYRYANPEDIDPCEIPYDYLDSRWYGYAEPYRTITITGGEDAENAELIAWLEANATQLDVDNPADPDPGDDGSDPDPGPGPEDDDGDPPIVDLTNTRWLLNESLGPMAEYDESIVGWAALYDIDFVSNGIEFKRIFGEHCNDILAGNIVDELRYCYANPPEEWDLWAVPYWFNDGYWLEEYQVYRTITITGGEDATNPDLITWIKANAVQLSIPEEPEDPDDNPEDPGPGDSGDGGKPVSATFDLSTLNLPAGTHTVYVTLSAEGYRDSEPSNVVEYKITEEVEEITPYLTFSSPSSFTLATNNSTKNWDGTLEYSTDTSTWDVWDGTTTLSAEDGKLYLRGIGNTKISPELDSLNTYRWVLSGVHIACNGNIETLLDYATVINGQHPPMADRCFVHLFSDCTNLIEAPTLPAISLSNYCYTAMFYNCINLTEAPALPATTLGQFCYMRMFESCTSLVEAPILPATILTNSCYTSMFRNCTNLVEAPALPATTLTSSCYMRMFEGCTNLVKIPALPATTLVSECYGKMFYDCTKIKLSTT